MKSSASGINLGTPISRCSSHLARPGISTVGRLWNRCMTFADCRLQAVDCRLQTADCRLQTADCRPQIADCKLNDTKNLPNKSDVINNITSCESENITWEQG